MSQKFALCWLIAAISCWLALWSLVAERIRPSLWYDELFSWIYANSIFETPQEVLENDVHPPLYFVLLRCWISLLGDSEASMRFLSGLFAVGSIFLFSLLSKQILAKPSWIPVFLLVLSPHFFEASATARMHSMLLFLNLVSAWSILKLEASKQCRWLVLLIAALTLNLHTSFLGLFWILIGCLYFCLRGRLNYAAMVVLIPLALGVPALHQLRELWGSGVFHMWTAWVPEPKLWDLFVPPAELLGVPELLGPIVLLIPILNLRLRRDPPNLLLLSLSSLSCCLLFLISLGKSIFVPRYLLPTVPFFALALAALPKRLQPILFLLLFLQFFTLLGYVRGEVEPPYPIEQWGDVANYLNLHSKRSELVVLLADSMWVDDAFQYYYRGEAEVRLFTDLGPGWKEELDRGELWLFLTGHYDDYFTRRNLPGVLALLEEKGQRIGLFLPHGASGLYFIPASSETPLQPYSTPPTT